MNLCRIRTKRLAKAVELIFCQLFSNDLALPTQQHAHQLTLTRRQVNGLLRDERVTGERIEGEIGGTQTRSGQGTLSPQNSVYRATSSSTSNGMAA